MSILITNPVNLRYLIGFTGSNGFLLLGKSENIFFTDFRYKDIALELEQKPNRMNFSFIELNKEFEQNFKKLAGGSVEFEANHLTIETLKRWNKRFPTLKWKPLKDKIEIRRAIKDNEEIVLLKKSQAINEDVLSRTSKLFKKGTSELEIAWKIKEIAHELGAEDISFEPIVAFGPHSATPHHQNTSQKWSGNEIIMIDMGVKYKGYCSDMTRTFLPKKTGAQEEHIYQKVLEAQKSAIAAIKPGVKTADLDKIARKSMGIDSKYFGHSLGHGIGLEVHESPNLSSKSKDVLIEGLVVTVEPGIYLSGQFGVRIEDMGRVGKNGYENFTMAAK